jgi:fermentation-respiration switch protein FrsA (DUF1100 family)
VRKVPLNQLTYLALAFLLAGCASPFYAGGESLLSRFEQAHVYQPARYPEGNWSPAGTRFEDVWFNAADGTRLNGWYLAHEKPVAVVLFAHGNAGNITPYAGMLRELHDRHCVSVMAFDYRGYGKSEGEPDEAGIVEDARAARHWLARREKIAEQDVVLLGQSLGGGVMVELAADDGARGLVLASTFTSLPDVAAHHFPLTLARVLMQNRLDSLSRIGGYHGPLLQVHGDKDRVIPLSLGKRLYAAAHEPKQFVVHLGGGHNDPWPGEFHRAFDRFLGSLPPGHPLPQPPRWHRTRVAGAPERAPSGGN